jgi:hypothetical protein
VTDPGELVEPSKNETCGHCPRVYWKAASHIGGGAIQLIVTGTQKLLLQKLEVVIVKQTRKVPLDVYVWETFGVLAMFPSPKFQDQATITPEVEVEKSVKATVGQLEVSTVNAGKHCPVTFWLNRRNRDALNPRLNIALPKFERAILVFMFYRFYLD